MQGVHQSTVADAEEHVNTQAALWIDSTIDHARCLGSEPRLRYSSARRCATQNHRQVLHFEVESTKAILRMPRFPKKSQRSGCHVIQSRSNKIIRGRDRKASVSFPAGDCAELQRLAENMKVSLAWVVRQAIEEYLAKQRRGSIQGKTG